MGGEGEGRGGKGGEREEEKRRGGEGEGEGEGERRGREGRDSLNFAYSFFNPGGATGSTEKECDSKTKFTLTMPT